MGFYDEMAQTATEMIREFGWPMILRSSSPQDEYDPIEGTLTVEADGVVNTPVFGVKIAPTVEYTQSMADGSVQSKDMLVYLEPSAKYPNLEDVLVIEDQSVIEIWQIVNVQEIKPAGVPLLYIVQVRP